MKIGDKAPDLLGLDADGNEIRLSNYPGKNIKNKTHAHQILAL